MNTSNYIVSHGELPRGTSSVAARIITVLLLLYVFVGFYPFMSANNFSNDDLDRGNIWNQIIWILFAFSLFPFVYRKRALFLCLLKNNYPLLILLFWCAASVGWATAPDISLRRVGLLLIVCFVAFGIVVSLPSIKEFNRIVVFVTGVVMLANVIGFVLLPQISMDGDGNLIGMHGHKNTAGLIATLSVLAWTAASWEAQKIGPKIFLWSGTILWIAALILTNSSTSLITTGTVILSVLIFHSILKIRIFGSAYMFLLLILLLIGILSLISIFPMSEVLSIVFKDATLTGRIFLWEFMAHEISRNPWLGVGFGSFWGVGDVGPGLTRGYGFVAGVGQGHNGYLDIVATVGLIGLSLTLFFIGHSAWKIRKVFILYQKYKVDSVELFSTAFIFLANIVHNGTESSLLRGGHLLWVLTIISIIYIHLHFLQMRSRSGVKMGAWNT